MPYPHCDRSRWCALLAQKSCLSDIAYALAIFSSWFASARWMPSIITKGEPNSQHGPTDALVLKGTLTTCADPTILNVW
jgi:hypothetical protein